MKGNINNFADVSDGFTDKGNHTKNISLTTLTATLGGKFRPSEYAPKVTKTQNLNNKISAEGPNNSFANKRNQKSKNEKLKYALILRRINNLFSYN